MSLGCHPLIVNPTAYPHLTLTGSWQVIVDPLSSGDASPVAVGVEGAGFYKDRVAQNGMELIEYAFSDAVQLQVPGDWNSQSERLFFYEGPIWYRKTFARPTLGERHFLYVGAANYAADIYVNGRLLGKHEGGFTPFNVEMTDHLSDGENLVVIKVDNRLGPATVPTRKTDWFNYGGLTRDVLVVSTPAVFIRDAFLRLTDLGARRLEIDVTVDGAKGGEEIILRLPELDQAVTLRIDADGQARESFQAAVELWSPANPRLYRVELMLGDTMIIDRVGFRTIRQAGVELLLNDQPVFLKGIAMHEETVLHPGRSHGEADARAMLQLAKELGANFVRLAHYPHDAATTRLADEMGLLIWSEIPVYWSIDWGSEAALATALSQLTENITRDRNRASIIVWSVSNETPMSEPRLAFLRALVGRARAMDSSRLVSSALFGNPMVFLQRYSRLIMAEIATSPDVPAETRATARAWLEAHLDKPITDADLHDLRQDTDHIIDDPIGADLDILAYNQYFGWYPAGALAARLPVGETDIRRAELAVMPRLRIEPQAQKPLIASEFGADAKAGFEGDTQTVFSEVFQARYYEIQLAMLANSTSLRGISPWVLKDFRTVMRTHPLYQQYWNRKGLVDENGQKKRAFGVLQDHYRDR